ncbi:MAG: pseudouridine synthase [Holosporales bacterium]|jgi:23S rRNA pseudouridine2605 synthase|nr:pseudouridine synthase [Holosporales bacterium]
MFCEKMRLAKFLSSRNVCSRRDAEKFIKNGEVSVNGSIITTPVCFVDGQDSIVFKGEPVLSSDKSASIWLYYKPVGEITTHKDPQHRTTVFEAVKKYGIGRVISIGRLDINSEGLLLLTDDSALAFQMEKSNDIVRTYKVRLFGSIDLKKFLSCCHGADTSQSKFNIAEVCIDGLRYKPFIVEFEAPLSAILGTHKNFWCSFRLIEGKNREIRKIANFWGAQVSRLIRTEYGTFRLDNMKPGEIKRFSPCP